MTDRMYDLTIRPLQDGGLELEQSAGSLDEPAVIHVHAAQLRLLAERAGLLAAPEPGMQLTARHRRWMLRLANLVDELGRLHLDEIIERCAYGLEFALRLRAIEDVLDDLMFSLAFERIPDEEASNAAAGSEAERHAIPAANSVTKTADSVTTRPGPKPSGNALSDAERQRRHRAKERQAELPALLTEEAAVEASA